MATREIRCALVLYGGVSLAVYENGVTRSFFDLVVRRGGFELLLELLDARAVVDVAAGTSAGGINGLLLAAALENGTDFAQTADLWRRLGDLGDLLRDAPHEGTESLLDGEGYYQAELFRAFHELVSRPPDGKRIAVEPGEIDVFITGTSLEGEQIEVADDLGQRIQDRTHRKVFHLRHRPGRRALGAGDTVTAPAVRAGVLAAIARITSTFPAAFPPFSLRQLDQIPLAGAPEDARRELGRIVQQSLERHGLDRHGHYVDGGVLDNKPFGPVQKAIFYRMPSRAVDRRLFYVEPDPGPQVGPPEAQPTDRRYSPLSVALSSLSSLPAHESLREDLIALEEHNNRVNWLMKLRADAEVKARDGGEQAIGAAQWHAYLEARRESIARSLCDDASDGSPPSAADSIPTAARALHTALLEALPATRDVLDCWDVERLLRKGFFALYKAHEALAKDPGRETLRVVVEAIGRLIQALELIRAAVLRRRDATTRSGARQLLDEVRALLADGEPTLLERLDARLTRLGGDDAVAFGQDHGPPFLAGLVPGACDLLEELPATDDLRRWDVDRLLRKAQFVLHKGHESLARNPRDEVRRAAVTSIEELIREIARVRDELLRRRDARAKHVATAIRDELHGLLASDGPLRETVGTLSRLEALQGVDLAQGLMSGLLSDAGFQRMRAQADARPIAPPAEGPTILQRLEATLDQLAGPHIARFDLVDALTFPAEFLTGIHELDQIEVVRISPSDAQLGLSKGELASKVAGETLGHFAAFLRRDWRASDIAYGRLDGVCQLVRALLTDKVLEGLSGASGFKARLEGKILPELETWLRGCPADRLVELRAAALGLCERPFPGGARFRAAYVAAMHERIAAEEVGEILSARAYQDTLWDLRRLPDGVCSTSSRDQIQTSAASCGREESKGETPWTRFERLRLGEELAVGKDGRVPLEVVGEYATRSGLLAWQMMAHGPNSLLNHASVRLLIHRPLFALNTMIRLTRQPGRVMPLVLVWGLGGLTLGATGISWVIPDTSWSVRGLCLLAFLIVCTVVAMFAPARVRRHGRRLATIGVALLVVAAALVVRYRASDVAAILERLAGLVRSLGRG